MITGYLAAEGFEAELVEELTRAGLGPSLRPAHGRLLISEAPPYRAAWAANIWFDAQELTITSVGDAAAQLRARQRSWALYAPTHRGRGELITAKLPHVSGRPLEFHQAAPVAPLGSWSLLRPDLLLAAAHCSSPFTHGQVPLHEHRVGPPSRAYLKLWEALVRLGRAPGPGDWVVDLGASPGGWTWLLSEWGARVLAVDKAPLHDAVSARSSVSWLGTSAFGLEPDQAIAVAHQRWGEQAPPSWVFGDIACYPTRLFALIERWRAVHPAPTLVFTVKFQGPTDHDTADRLAALPGAELLHLHHNRHELTLFISPPG